MDIITFLINNVIYFLDKIYENINQIIFFHNNNLFEFVIRSNETWKKYFPNQADWQTGKQAG
jgi:hypothetical protein